MIRNFSLFILLTLKDIALAQEQIKVLQTVKTSAQISAYYLTILKKSRKHYFNMVSGYNGGMSNNPYYKRVMKNIDLINQYVKSGQLI